MPELIKKHTEFMLNIFENIKYSSFNLNYKGKESYILTYKNKNYSFSMTSIKSSQQFHKNLFYLINLDSRDFISYEVRSAGYKFLMKNHKNAIKDCRNRLLSEIKAQDETIKKAIKFFIKDEFKKNIKLFCRHVKRKLNINNLEAEALVIKCLKEVQMENLFK